MATPTIPAQVPTAAPNAVQTRRRSPHRTYRIAATVMFTALSLTIIVPVAWILMASFKTKSEFFGSPWRLPKGFAFQNYVSAFFDAHMGQYFLNSVFVTALGLAVSLVVALPAAYALARYEFRGKSLIEGMLLAGLFINVNYVVVPIFLLLLGWDQALESIMPSGFFINNLFVLAVVYAATSLPFTVYLLSNYFKTIPTTYEEAAMLDGASRLRTMVSVMLPLAVPAISTTLLINFMSYWNDFILSLTLIPGDSKTLQVGLLNLFNAQRAAADYGRLYAGMVIVMLPVIIFYIVIHKRLLISVGGGGIK